MSRDDSELPAPSRRHFLQGSVASAVGMGSALLGAAPSSGALAQPTRSSVLLHHVPATAETVHWGYFSKKLKPVIEVSSGDYVMTTQSLTEDEAISLMSVAADFGVTQVVDGNWGVHAVIKKSLFTSG